MIGAWSKDYDQSDRLDEACALWKLNFVLRNAINLVRGLQLAVSKDGDTMLIFLPSVIKWFKIRESFPMSGTVTQNRRRDLRRGGARGTASADAEGAITVRNEWDTPIAGSLVDVLRIVGDELHTESTLTIGGQQARYRTVYMRRRE